VRASTNGMWGFSPDAWLMWVALTVSVGVGVGIGAMCVKSACEHFWSVHHFVVGVALRTLGFRGFTNHQSYVQK